MTLKISFADLTHTGQVVSANTFPLGAAMVASYAKKVLGDEIETEIFRYPDDFSRYLEHTLPRIACFSVFAWNMTLSHEYARWIKKMSPETVVIFGGVNIPDPIDGLREFLVKYPAIDLCVEGEGEIAFVELYKILKQHDFDFAAIKAAKLKLPNGRYLAGDQLVVGPMLPRIEDLNIVPSTFENGMSDKFFDDHLIPMIQSARGCPYSCTFCHEGADYFTKTRRVSQDRVHRELKYIAERVKVPDFIITDLNFGIFEEDIDTSNVIAGLQQDRGWPKFVTIATAKNNKERVLEISKILKGSLPPGAAVQSTSPEVLKEIKRKNLPMDAVIAVAKTSETDGAVSFSEIILCLPGDTKESYFKSVTDTVDAGFTLVRSYQFMLLNSTEAASKTSRAKYAMETRFRVKPMNFGIYQIRGEWIAAAEVEEICIGNSTMPHADYLVCRKLSLTVEIFNNNGIFFDLLQYLARKGIRRSDFLMRIHKLVTEGKGPVSEFYESFQQDENKNFWKSQEELENFLARPGTIERYLEGEYGTNEIYKFRALCVFDHMDALHDIAYTAARQLLREKSTYDEWSEEYLSEWKVFSHARKSNTLDLSCAAPPQTYKYDFTKLAKSNFTLDPLSLRVPEGIKIELYHTPWQKDMIEGYIRQFGSTLVGRGRILNRAHIAAMYRTPRYANEAGSARGDETLARVQSAG